MSTAKKSMVVLAAVVWLVVFSAGPALGHATLVDTDPVDGSTLESSPAEITLRFDEPVTVSPGAIRVFDAARRRVDTGEVSGSGDSVVAPLRGGLSDGAYVVTWRVVSADGHPLQGAFVYRVGTGEAPDESFLESLVQQGSATPWAVAGVLARWLGYAGALIVAGGVLFRFVVRRDTSLRPLRVAAWTGLLASLGTLFFYGPEVTGLGIEAVFDPETLGRTVSGPVGISALVRGVALAGFLFFSSRGSWPAAATGAVALASYLLTGHTLTSEPAVVRIGADVGHLVGTSVWVGGLVMLWSSLRESGGSAPDRARTVARFSWLAGWAVALLAAAGLALAWVEVRALHAIDTPYGWTLLIKVALVVVVLAVAAYNRRRLVPVIERTGEDSEAWRRLRRTLTFEVVGVVVVLAVTAVLANLQPAREVAGVEGPVSVYQPIGNEGWQANVVVDPNRAGVNEIHVYLLSGAGRPLDAPQGLILELTMPEEEIGPVVREPEPAGPAHWILTGPELAIPGEWEIMLRLQRSETEEMRAAVTVHVNP